MGRLVTGLAVLGLLVGGACGDDGDGASRAEIEEFCNGFNEINEAFANSNADLVGDQTALQEAVSKLRDLHPPDEIADEYATVIAGFEPLSEIDLTDPAEVARVQDELRNAEDAFDAVARFVDDEC